MFLPIDLSVVVDDVPAPEGIYAARVTGSNFKDDENRAYFIITFKMYDLDTEKTYVHKEYYTVKHTKPEPAQIGLQTLKRLMLAAGCTNLKLTSEADLLELTFCAIIDKKPDYNDKTKFRTYIKGYTQLDQKQQKLLKDAMLREAVSSVIDDDSCPF
jgi:hypothetical protein